MASWSETVLKLVNALNSFTCADSSKSSCIPFVVDSKMIGTVPPHVVKELKNYPDVFEITSRADSVKLASELTRIEQRDEAVARVLEEIRKKDIFVTLKGWRHELYSVRSNLSEPPLLNIERSACCLFGVIQYGVHMNGYTIIDGEVKMWISKRSATKPTFPNMYDNMCAGGLTGGMGIRECAMKECQEEASIDDEVLKRLKYVDCISYYYEDERGIFPENQFIFDIEMPNDFIPKNADGEMQNFQLLSLDKVKELIMGGNFKPNCALCVVNFLIRHGYMTPDDEPLLPYIIEMSHYKLQPAH